MSTVKLSKNKCLIMIMYKKQDLKSKLFNEKINEKHIPAYLLELKLN